MYTVEQIKEAGAKAQYRYAVEPIIEALEELYGSGISQNSGNAIVSGSLPPDFEIEIYPSYGKGKWAARCQGWISEPFDTPQDALKWGVKQAAMTANVLRLCDVRQSRK